MPRLHDPGHLQRPSKRCDTIAGPLMSDQIKTRWRLLAKWMIALGAVWFFSLFIWFIALIEFYYPSHRPEFPQPQKGYTTGLTWTHPPRYGTTRDESRSHWLFNLSFVGFGFMIAGELVKIYRLNDHSGLRVDQCRPWNRHWGP